MKLNSQQTIDRLIADCEAINHIVKHEFEPLNSEQLNWQTAPNKWSINQCLEHMNIALRLYMPNMKKVLKKSEKNAWTSNKTYSTGWMGNMAAKSLKPKIDGAIKLKMKTLKGWSPGIDAPENPNALADFLQLNNNLLELLEEARNYDLGKAKVPTSIRRIQFKLGDSFRFIIAHNQRHIKQAQNVLAQIALD